MGESCLRPEDEAEGGRGTADGRLVLMGPGEPIEVWMGADAAVRSEKVDADSALRMGRARRKPEGAAPGHRWVMLGARAGVLRLRQPPRCQGRPGASGQPKLRASSRVKACGDRARTVARSYAHRNISLWFGETCATLKQSPLALPDSGL